jgi:hypothetical protein
MNPSEEKCNHKLTKLIDLTACWLIDRNNLFIYITESNKVPSREKH